jgi:hypothetical protein
VRHRKNSPVFSLKWFAALAVDAWVNGKGTARSSRQAILYGMIQISANEWQVFIAERLSLKTGHSFHVIYTLGIFDVKRILCQIPGGIARIGSAKRLANLAPSLAAIYNKFVRGPARFRASTFRTELGERRWVCRAPAGGTGKRFASAEYIQRKVS